MINNFNINNTDFLREIYIETDNNKTIKFISENCYTTLGYKSDELVNKDISKIISTIPLNITSTTNFQGTIKLKDSNTMDIDVKIAPILDINGSITGLKLSLLDISKCKKTKIDKKILLGMLERSKDIIYRCDLVPEFKFIYISPSIYDILGYTVEEHATNPTLPFQIVHPDHKEYLLKKLTCNFDFYNPKPVKFKHKNGSYVWLEDYNTPIYDDNGKLIIVEGVSRDITERKKLEEKLEKLSFYDGLTGLYNKLYSDKQIDILNTEEDTSVGIIFCDLDNLKVTNDTIGHAFGDKLIIYTSNILKDTFKENSIIARIGGDEFIVIIKDTNLHKVKELYSILLNSIKQQNKYNDELPINISIGYSFSETSIGIIRQVINIADKNMYKDKQRKKL